MLGSPPLTGKQRRYLRALAHDQKPVIQVGHSGLTQGVIQAIDAALLTHELIKVKVLGECPDDLDAITPKLERATRSSVAQAIGRTLVVYRRRAENPKIALPGTPGTSTRAKKRAPQGSKRAPTPTAEGATRAAAHGSKRATAHGSKRATAHGSNRATAQGSQRPTAHGSKRPTTRDRRR